MGSPSPSEDKKTPVWATAIAKCLAIPVWVGTYALEFARRLFFTEEMRIERKIENLKNFLAAVNDLTQQMEANGFSKKEIRETLERLSVPAAEAALKAILLSQACSSGNIADAINDVELSEVGRRISGESMSRLESK